MKILIAIDSFKGSATSNELSSSIKEGVLKVNNNINIIISPIADGGEGTLEALQNEKNTQNISLITSNPLDEKIESNYLIIDNKTALIEMAKTSGLDLIPLGERNPMITSTYGTGELIKDAINKGIKKFIIAIGGSATNDAGLGMLNALGFEFFDSHNNKITATKDMKRIIRISSINALKELDRCEFLIACDVNNPLTGQNGASFIYAKQKGADEQMIKELDENLKYFASIVQKDTNKKFDDLAGAGAAGGLGFGFLAFLNSELKPGIDLILELTNFEEKLKRVDLVITGEGKIDNQSSMGKVLSGIGKLCLKHNKKCIALAGNTSECNDDIHSLGITSVFCIQSKTSSLENAMKKENTLKNIKKTSEQVIRLFCSNLLK